MIKTLRLKNMMFTVVLFLVTLFCLLNLLNSPINSVRANPNVLKERAGSNLGLLNPAMFCLAYYWEVSVCSFISRDKVEHTNYLGNPRGPSLVKHFIPSLITRQNFALLLVYNEMMLKSEKAKTKLENKKLKNLWKNIFEQIWVK